MAVEEVGSTNYQDRLQTRNSSSVYLTSEWLEFAALVTVENYHVAEAEDTPSHAVPQLREGRPDFSESGVINNDRTL
jgi:hypothetical protein